MKLLRTYLKSRRRTIFACLAFAILLLVSFRLYHLPLAAVLYPMSLCLLLGIVLLLVDFGRILRLHRRLEHLADCGGSVSDELPRPDTIPEADYCAIAEKLCAEIRDGSEAAALRYRDMVDYYSVWAHQIKTPIAAMKLTLQQEDSSYARRLSGDLFRIEQYVEMVLAFLRLEPGGTDYVFRETSLDAVIRPELRKFAPEFIGRKLKLDYQTMDTKLVTDEKWLGFVIGQLLSNALKYTRSGGVRLCLREPMCLCISDTGIGIAPEDLPRIFEKGYTGYNGRTERTASGIGLYLCRRICENLGIGIRAESTVGAGTTIVLDLSREVIRVE